MQNNIHETITNQIIEAIKAGAEDFKMPWSYFDIEPLNALTKADYHGINFLYLMMQAHEKGYESGYWATFKQWKELGASVQKGEKSSIGIVYKDVIKTEADAVTGEELEEHYKFIKSFPLFNADQISGWEIPEKKHLNKAESIKAADAFIRNSGANIIHNGGRAYFDPTKDLIRIPEQSQFDDTEHGTATEAYYSTLLHELTHWTGHKSRLSRDTGTKAEKEKYAFEELVAELGAAFLCSELGISPAPRKSHGAYIASWVKILENDNRAIFKAAGEASKAVDFLKGLQPPEPENKKDWKAFADKEKAKSEQRKEEIRKKPTGNIASRIIAEREKDPVGIIEKQ
jgi:antirestriction protein ArdC